MTQPGGTQSFLPRIQNMVRGLEGLSSSCVFMVKIAHQKQNTCFHT